MLASSNRFVEAGVELVTHVSLERDSTLFYLRKRGLTYDGRTQPRSHAPSRGRSSFYLLLGGELRLSTGRDLNAPALVRMKEDVLEGANGERPATLCISGDPHLSLVLHVAPDCVDPPNEAPFDLLPLPPDLLAAARSYCQVVESTSELAPCQQARDAFLEQLVNEGMIRLPVKSPSSRAFRVGETVGQALCVFFSRLDAAPTIAVVADLARISPRTTDRLLKQFTEAYGLPNEGLRALALRWRLKLATLLLSSDALSVRRIAQRVGYRNAEALANALAAEGLPAPSEYRQQRGGGVNS